MYRDCLRSHIINIQCKQGQLGSVLSTQLELGSRKVVCLDRFNAATTYLLRILRCYTPFAQEVTYAYKFVFDRSVAGSVSIDMTLKDNVLATYTGTGTGEEIAIYFQNLIDAGGLTIDYLTERVGNVLYVYSYDAAASFTDTTTTTSSSTSVTVTQTILQNDLDEILNLWNSLTESEICNLITLATNASMTGATLGKVTGNSGCNC